MKSDLPLFYYQPNDVSYFDKSCTLNKKIFKNIIVLKQPYYEKFDKVYKHMCYNHDEFERLCFRRYFVMLDYVKENKIDKFLYSDSDAIFVKVLNFEKVLGKQKSILCKPEEQNEFEDVVGTHFSIWTREGLESFCNFIIDTYTKNIQILEPKWQWHMRTATGGGICDMTLLYHWYGEEKSLLDIYEGGTFDRTIGTADNKYKNEFAMNSGIKKLKKKDNKIFGITNKNEEVELYGIHFQGTNKHLMNLL